MQVCTLCNKCTTHVHTLYNTCTYTVHCTTHEICMYIHCIIQVCTLYNKCTYTEQHMYTHCTMYGVPVQHMYVCTLCCTIVLVCNHLSTCASFYYGLCLYKPAITKNIKRLLLRLSEHVTHVYRCMEDVLNKCSKVANLQAYQLSMMSVWV